MGARPIPEQLQRKSLSLYYDSGYNHRQIHKVLGTNIYHILELNNSPTKTILRREKVLSHIPSDHQILRLYRHKGLSAPQIAEIYSPEEGRVTTLIQEQITASLKRNGIRSTHRPRKKYTCTQCKSHTAGVRYNFGLPFCSPICQADWLASNTDEDFLCTTPIFYVYALVTPIAISVNSGKNLQLSPGDYFYIGKGHGDRAYGHEKPNSGNLIKLQIIRQIREEGYKSEVIKLVDRVSEREAFEQEIRWIDKIGIENLANVNHGGLGEKATEDIKRSISWAVREAYKDPEVKQRLINSVRERTSTPEWKKAHEEGMKNYHQNYPWARILWRLFDNHHRFSASFPPFIQKEMKELYSDYLDGKIIGKEIFPSKDLAEILVGKLPMLNRRLERCVRFCYTVKGMSIKQIQEDLWLTPKRVGDIVRKIQNKELQDKVSKFIGNDLEKIVLHLYQEEKVPSIGVINEKVRHLIKEMLGRDYPCGSEKDSYRSLLKKEIGNILGRNGLTSKQGKPPLTGYTEPYQLTERMEIFCDAILEGFPIQVAGQATTPPAGPQQIDRWLHCEAIRKYLIQNHVMKTTELRPFLRKLKN